jgi:hypothetical protein
VHDAHDKPTINRASANAPAVAARWLPSPLVRTRKCADMPRKRKVPDPAEFDVPRKRLWQWLVEHTDVNTEKIRGNRAAARRAKIQRINYEATTSGDPSKKHAGAVAGALLDLEMAATERATAKWYLKWRADTLDKATQADQLVKSLRKSWRDLEARAKADRPDIPPMRRYWPEEIVRVLAARDMALAGALAFIIDYRVAVEKLGENVWGADTSPDMLHMIDHIALHLADGGFSSSEIAGFLDETGGRQELKADRWRKRVDRARKALQREQRPTRARKSPRRSKHGAEISDAKRTGGGEDVATNGIRRTTSKPAPSTHRRAHRPRR